MTTRIENVLAARDASLRDENDWEEFALTDVKVLVPGKTRYANVLFASVDNPVRVTGQLEIVEEEQEELVLDDSYRNKRVLIDNVTHYAYGQHDDGEIGLWVAGVAGWFSISPARGYKPMFNEMVEAIDLLYFLADKHQKSRKRGKKWNPKVDYLFDEYTKHTNGTCEDAEDSAEVFYKHHEFLINQMVRGKENVDWASTPIYAHLRELYLDVFERAEAAADEAQEKSESDEESDVSPDASAVGKAQADTIFEVVLDMKESGLLSKRRLNVTTVAETLLKRYEMSSLTYALDLIRARAGFLIEMMEDAQTATFDWSQKAIYRQLKDLENSGSLQGISDTPLHPRPRRLNSSSSPSAEESEDNEEIHVPKGRRRRVRKSLLRPKMSSVSAKGAGKRNRQAKIGNTDSEEEIEELSSPNNTPSKIRGHRLVHDPLSAKVNESTRSIVSGSDVASLRKTPMQDIFERLMTPNAIINNSENVNQTTEPPDHVELPADTWICSIQGCGKTIYKASSKRSKEAILDHSLVHAEDTQTKLNLVFAEQRHNINVSVSHLVSRIRDFGAHQESVGTSDKPEFRGPTSPKKIKL
ncbi:conserved hypothetical protein [Histoplasma capsulatum G186AR]|uniref:DNA (cytosine-5)-methyltransferase 1 replication foci domain-containing protein n=2 Tax=Ajellomyces capsulatus TaxID=5037 RepID=C0NFL9_AJECG|nr:uncharacterized protein HCBG_01685 [Histoplasma capsulatum G186AR]EEH10040.1 conserved hypothetical protein [Histoplasma capsulatum G186AR]KAG5291014.1 hypothetical protein I7I52_08207 [Histoplasma capsulatum]QSS72942.1 hypothetical protein I7I50_00941 [Histoplasma capsulatum G186AR]